MRAQHVGGCSVHREYHEYIGDVQYIGGYHDSCGEYRKYIRTAKYIEGIS